MSYSYVKTVFPGYEFSNLYNDQVYNIKPNNEPLNVIGITNENIDNYTPIKNNTQVYNKPIINQHIPNYNNISKNHFAVPDQDPQPLQSVTPHNYISYNEEFGNESGSIKNNTVSHLEYIKHINNCPSCRQELLKLFNIETERIRNEEIMELISYIIFGIMLYILLESLKK